MGQISNFLYLIGVGLCAYTLYNWFSKKGDQKFIHEKTERNKASRKYGLVFSIGVALIIVASLLRALV